MMRRKIQANQKDVEEIKKQNAILEAQSKWGVNICKLLRKTEAKGTIFL